MTSKLEQLRQTDRSTSRLTDQEILFNEYEKTDKTASFTTFVNDYTINEKQPTKIRADLITLDWYNPETKETVSPDRFVGGLEGAYDEDASASIGQKILQTLPKEPRRMVAGFSDTLFSGSVGLASDVAQALNPTNIELPERFKKFSEQNYQQALGSTFGYDLIEVTQDKEGEYYYDLEKPQTTVGSLATNVGAFFAAMSKAKNPIKTLTTPKRKQGGQSKKTQRKFKAISTAQNIAAAEIAGQIVIDPEEGRLGYQIGQWAGENDRALLDTVFEYLDLEDPAELSTMENRIGMLGESLVAGGIIVGTAKTFVQTLKGVVAGGRVAVKQFKNTVDAGQKSDRAFKVKEDLSKQKLKFKVDGLKNPFYFKEETDNVFQAVSLPSIIENSPFRGVTQRTLNTAKKVWKKAFTSKGIQSEQMFSIINQAENAKVALSEKALNTVARLENLLRVATKEISTGPFQLKGRISNYKKLDEQFKGYLTGTVKLKDLPKKLQPIAIQIQKTVAELSKDMTGRAVVPEKIRDEISKDMGKYLRQTYEIFENPKWSPSREVQLTAINYIAKSLRRTKGYREVKDGVDDAARFKEATKRVDDLLSDIKGAGEGVTSNVVKHINQMYGTQTANKIFANKKVIAPEIKALLGETKSSPTSVFRTLTTVSHYITDIKMYNDLFSVGQGKYFFDDGIKRANTVQIKGQQFHALNGKFTTPEIAEMFNKQAEQVEGWRRLYDNLLMIKGMGQASATVLNNITHLRNTLGQTIIMAENGLNPFGAETAQSFKVLQNTFKNSKNQNKTLSELYNKYQKLGLVNQNVKVNEFKRLLNDASFGMDNINAVIGQSLVRRGLNVIGKPIKATYKGAEKLYVAEDDLFRIAAYEKELKVLKQANKSNSIRLSKDQLERKAAEIIRDTMPTYDLIPSSAKFLRKMPFGNFFAFSAERFRNTYHTLKRSRDEINSGNKVLEERGFNRLAGKIGIGLTGSYAVQESSKLIYGVTEDLHQAYKDLALPDWSKNSAIAYLRNDKGELLYFDMSYTDPDAPVLDVIRATLGEFTRKDRPTRGLGKDIGVATLQGMKKFFEPYVSEALLSQAVLDVAFGKGISKSGSRIPGWDEGADEWSWNNLGAAFSYTVNTLVPAAYKNLAPESDISFIPGGKKGSLGEQLYRELTNKPEYRRFDGTEKDINMDLLANTTGIRLYKLDEKSMQTALGFKVRDFKKNRDIYRSTLDRATTYNSSLEDVLDQYVTENTKYYYKQTSLNKAIRAAYKLDLNVSREFKYLKGARNEEINNLIEGSGYFTPLQFSSRQLNNAIKKSSQESMSFNEFRMRLAKLEQQFMHLPLLEFKEADKKESYSEEFPEREQKVEGGLIKGEEVPFTQEKPEERINPFTGEPYVAIYKRDRLGFAEGKNATLENWYNISQKQKTLDSDNNANQYVQAQINRLTNTLGVEYSDEAFENLKKMQRIFSTAESDNRQTTQNKYEQYEGASRDALTNLLANADKNKINKEWLQSIDPTKPETWDDGQADTMMLGYIFNQKGTDKQVSQILQGNFGTNEEGPVRNLYQDNWVRAKLTGEYETINPDSDAEGNFKRSMDLNL